MLGGGPQLVGTAGRGQRNPCRTPGSAELLLRTLPGSWGAMSRTPSSPAPRGTKL